MARQRKNCRKKEYIPSHEEIRAECQKLQSRWSRFEERKRRAIGRKRVELMVCHVDFIR